MSIRQFLIVIEKVNKNFSAYSPDLPGCVATGRTRRETERNMHEAIQLHLAGMIEDGNEIPKAQTSAAYVLSELPRRSSGRTIAKNSSSRQK